MFRDPFPNNIITPDRFDPVAVRIQALFPATIGPNANALTQNYINSYTTSRITEVPSLKVDQKIGQNGRLSFFWQRTKTENPNGNTIFGQSDGLPEPLTTALGTFQNAPLYRLNYDHTLSPTLLLHLGAGYRSNYFFVPSVTPDGEIRNYNAEQELGLHRLHRNGILPAHVVHNRSQRHRWHEEYRLVGCDEQHHAEPQLQCLYQLGQKQSRLQVRLGVPHRGISAQSSRKHFRHLQFLGSTNRSAVSNHGSGWRQCGIRLCQFSARPG